MAVVCPITRPGSYSEKRRGGGGSFGWPHPCWFWAACLPHSRSLTAYGLKLTDYCRLAKLCRNFLSRAAKRRLCRFYPLLFGRTRLMQGRFGGRGEGKGGVRISDDRGRLGRTDQSPTNHLEMRERTALSDCSFYQMKSQRRCDIAFLRTNVNPPILLSFPAGRCFSLV